MSGMGESDYFTNQVREEGLSWNSFQAARKVKAVRVYFVKKKDKKVKHRFGEGWISQIAESIDNQVHS